MNNIEWTETVNKLGKVYKDMSLSFLILEEKKKAIQLRQKQEII